jgi:HlyD family secretion protein
MTTRLRDEVQTRLRSIESRLIELAERRRSMRERIARIDICAPVASTVYGLQGIRHGAAVRPAEAVLTIAPKGRALIVPARVPVVAIHEVTPGQATTVNSRACVQWTAPDIFGTVTRISADTFVDEATAQAFYRAGIALPQDELAKLGQVTPAPGMPV